MDMIAPVATENIAALFSDFIAYLERKGIRARTIQTYRYDFGYFCDYLARREVHRVEEITSAVLRKYIYRQLTTTSEVCGRPVLANTINGRMSALRSFFAYLIKAGVLTKNPARLIKSLPEERKALMNYLTQSEIAQVLAALPQDSFLQRLCRMAIILSYNCALRLTEMRFIRAEDVDIKSRMLTVREGKGGYPRTVPISDQALEHLTPYLAEHPEGDLFPSPRISKPITGEVVREHLQRWCRKCGIEKQVNHHTLRHSIAKHLLERGLDVRYVQKFLGHQSINTTAQYTRLNLAELREALEKYHPRETQKTRWLLGIPGADKEKTAETLPCAP